MRPSRCGRLTFVETLLSLVLVIGGSAQSWAAPGPGGPDPQAARPVDPPTPDFLFGQPRGWFGIGASLVMPRAGGELFTFINKQLTVDQGDFRAPGLNFEAGVTLTPRMDIVAGAEMSQSNISSEYRNLVSDNRLPINQVTKFDRVDVSGGLRIALRPRGRNVSRYVYVPRSFTPYVGAGGGAMYYKFFQQGEFVDFVTFRIFKDTFSAKGWTPSGHVFGGADLRLWKALFLNVDARYVWAHGGLGVDFVGFDGIDLNGFRVATGVSVVMR